MSTHLGVIINSTPFLLHEFFQLDTNWTVPPATQIQALIFIGVDKALV